MRTPLAVFLAAVLAGGLWSTAPALGQVEPGAPTPPATQAPTEESPQWPRQVELKKSWFQRANGTLTLRREQDSLAVEGISAELDCRAAQWRAGVLIDSELLGDENQRLRLYAERAFFGDRAKGFARWSNPLENSASTFNAGLEGSLFGADRWLFTREIGTEAGQTEVKDTYGLTVPIPLLGVDRLQLTRTQGAFLEELKGELTTKVQDRLELGASVGAQKPAGQGAGQTTWSAPEVRGNLRVWW